MERVASIAQGIGGFLNLARGHVWVRRSCSMPGGETQEARREAAHFVPLPVEDLLDIPGGSC